MRFHRRLLVLVLTLSAAQAFQCSTSSCFHQNPEFFVCPNDNWIEKSLSDATNTSDCDYKSVLPNVHCAGPGHQLPLCWRVHNPTTGLVEVTFPPLPPQCNFTRYYVQLLVYEGEGLSHACPPVWPDYQRHSKREVHITECTESSCFNQCTTRISLQFRHVFSGCYSLHLQPMQHNQGYQSLDSTPVLLNTLYSKSSGLEFDVPIINLHTSDKGLSMSARLDFVPSSSLITLIDVNSAPRQEADCSTGKSVACCTTCLGSSEIRCRSLNGGSDIPSCSYYGDSTVNCDFPGVRSGNYCARVQFDDDRCVVDSVWQPNVTCTWQTFQVVEPINSGVLHLSTSIRKEWFIFLTIAVLAVCVMGGLLLYQRHKWPNYPHLLPVHDKTPQDTERPQILLLYARDCPAFMSAVTQLRTVLTRIYHCQVLDCWDPGQYELVARGPARWVQAQLADSGVRTILVTSGASLAYEREIVGGRPSPCYKLPRAFDCVLTYALTALHEARRDDSYKRLFIVRLDTTSEANRFFEERTYLNPLVLYELPLHLNKLIATLHNLGSRVYPVAAEGQSEVAHLTFAISEYRQYLRKNPQYLNNLLDWHEQDP